jgi:16S rRNA (adenine1518-N6/adenine1519-N6)-dimethyltransferase
MAHQPRKRFGQNFLHDPAIIRRIVRAISPREGDCMVEIGPGQGAITLHLLDALNQLQAIELDRDLIQPLSDLAKGHGELTIHNCDALNFDFSTIAAGGHSLRVTGNLPYNISTPILFHLLGQVEVIRDMHFMLQKEVVQRMAAAPGSKTYGRLSVMIQVACDVAHLFDIGPGAFRPPPKVDSSLVRLTPLHSPPNIQDFPLFQSLVAAAFSQRRKTLRNSLQKLCSETGIEAAGIDPKIRPEQLPVSAFVELANTLSSSRQTTQNPI